MKTSGTMLLLYLAVTATGLADPSSNELRLAIRRGTGQQVDLNWNEPGSNRWYTLESCTSLTAGAWALAAPVDDWPWRGTNWSTSTKGIAFFRGRATKRGGLISTSLLRSYTTTDIINLMRDLFGGPILLPRYAVDVYRIEYETFDHRGLSVSASGALILPSSGALPAPMVSYQHGTVFERDAAPSSASSLDRSLAVIMATDGYVVSAPDYLGLGSNAPPLHPYLHARSEAVACVDMLRASHTFISSNNLVSLNGKFFLIGYSQGGHATLVLQKELEQHHAAEFPITASAPMAGPHDLSGTMLDAMLSDAAYANPAYLPYLLFGYHGIYGLYRSLSDVLASPYDVELPPLFDGAHSSSEINAVMPSVPKQIFKTEYLAEFSINTNHPFRAVLRANDTYRWTPRTPTKFYHCAGDTVVPKLNSWVAYSNFVSRGASNIWIEDPSPTSNHSDGALECFKAAASWFSTLR